MVLRDAAASKKHIVLVINIFPLSAQAKGGSKSFVWWDQRILCRPLIVFFADERKLTTLSQSASAPSCQDNHHSQCNPIYVNNVWMLQWQDSTLALQKYLILALPQRVLKNQKTKKDIFTFSVAPFQLPPIKRGLLECIRRSSVVIAGCYWKQKEKLV